MLQSVCGNGWPKGVKIIVLCFQSAKRIVITHMYVTVNNKFFHMVHKLLGFTFIFMTSQEKSANAKC